jgi:hypothetical protein
MPTASIQPSPGILRIEVAGEIVLHTMPWVIGKSQYDIEGVGGGSQVGSFQHGGSTPIHTSTTVPYAMLFYNPQNDTFSGFSIGDDGNMQGDGIYIAGGGDLRFDNDYITSGAYGAAWHVAGVIGLYMNHDGCQGGGLGGLACVLFDTPDYNADGTCCAYINDLFTAEHGLGFMGPGGNGFGYVYNTFQVNDWLQENQDNADNGLITVDAGPNAPGQINTAGFPLIGVGLKNISNSDVALQYSNMFSVAGSSQSQVQEISLVNSALGGQVVACVNGSTACPASLIGLFSDSSPFTIGDGYRSSGFLVNHQYGFNTTTSANVSMGPLLFHQNTAGAGSYAIPAWAMVLPPPQSLTVTGTSTGSLSAGTYCIGVGGVDMQTSGLGQTNLSNTVCQTVGASSSIQLSFYEGQSDSLNQAYGSFNLWYCTTANCNPGVGGMVLLPVTTAGADPVTINFTSTSAAVGPYNALTNSNAQLSWLSWDWSQAPYSCFFCTRAHQDYWPVGFGIIPTAGAGYNIYTKLGVHVGTTALLGNLAGSGTQCVQASNTGVLSGTGASCGSGSGTVTSIATSSPLSGGPITTSGTISCPTCTQTIASGTSALGTSSISSGACATTVTGTATGALTTDNLSADFNTNPSGITGYGVNTGGILTLYKWITSGQVNFAVCNSTGSTVTPGSATLQWRVIR